jgi:carbon monoxide dehydrogenase subunit G
VQGRTEHGLKFRVYASVVLRAGFAGFLAIAAAPPAAAAATIAIESERDGEIVNIRARAVLNADVATAWRVLTDYDRYAEFIPDLRLSRVVARRGSTVTVEQSGDATWLFKFPLDITYEINEVPPSRLQSRAVAGSLRSLVSSYTLTPAHPGTRLDYSGHVEPGFALFGQIEQTAVERNVARQFQALADEIERQGAHAPSQPVAKCEVRDDRSRDC